MPPTTLREAALKHQAFFRITTLSAVVLALTLSACRKDRSSPTTKAQPDVPQTPGTQLISGRSIDPDASRSAQDVGSFPINIALAPGGKFAVTTGQGYRQHVWAVRTEDGKGVSQVNFPNPTIDKSNGLYYGLAFGPDGTLYAAQGSADKIAVLGIDDDGKLTPRRRFDTRRGDFPSGLALDGRGLLYVANNDPDSTHLEKPTPASVAVFDPGAGKEVGRFVFDTGVPGSNFPLALAAVKDGS